MGYYSKILHLVRGYSEVSTPPKWALMKLMVWNAIYFFVGDHKSKNEQYREILKEELRNSREELNILRDRELLVLRDMMEKSVKKQLISLSDFSEKDAISDTKDLDISYESDIHVVFISDDGYALPTAVALTSIMNSAQEPKRYWIHIVSCGMSDESKKLLYDSGDNVEIVEVDADWLASINFEHSHVSKAALLKFKLPEIFDSLDKALYIDGDVLVQKDLCTFFNTDINDSYAAVIKDYHISRTPYIEFVRQYGIEEYFNSGVMLLNLDKLRKDGISKKLIEKKIELTKNAKFTFMDQDALNMVFLNKVKFMPVECNFLNCYYAEISPTEMSKLTEMNICKISEMYEKPMILHIGGGDKPWLYRYGERAILYRRYLKMNKEYREKKEWIH